MSGILVSLLVGLIAGIIASWLMPGGASGWIMNIILGLLGGVVGHWVLGLLNISTGSGFWGSLITAVIGACILIALYNFIARKKKK